MKHFKAIFLICTAVFAFTACSSDDNDNNWGDQPDHSENYIEFNGETYPLKFGVIESEGNNESDDESYEYNISFATTVFSEDEEGNWVPEENILSLIGFEVYSDNPLLPETGEYDFTEEELVNFTFASGIGFINLDFESIANGEDLEDTDFEQLISIKSGTIKILQTGETYEIEMNLINYNGKPVVGYYKGELTPIVESPDRPFPL